MVVAMSPDIRRSLADREAAFRRGDPATWGQIGQWLNEVERTEYWQGRTKSFTEWLKSSAPDLKLKEGSLWRYLTASRYYSRLREQLQAEGFDCPTIETLPDTVSPESLELLSKIGRVVGQQTFRDLAIGVLSGEVSRAVLRRRWQAYRPVVVESRSRRHRGRPSYDPTDARQSESMLLATTRVTLDAEALRWAGEFGSGLLRFCYDVPVGIPEETSNSRTLEMVAVTRTTKDAPIRFHVMKIVPQGLAPNVLEQIAQELTPYGDYVWLVFPTGGANSAACLPAHVGLLETRGCLRVVRPAATDASLGSATGETAKGVLTKTL